MSWHRKSHIGRPLEERFWEKVDQGGDGTMSETPSAENDAPTCRGCGAPASCDTPAPDHCGDCPPWTCDGCGSPCSMADPCACWISLEGLALADIKGLLALGDLSVTHVIPPASGDAS